jgi:hypothetical protein
MTTEIRHGPYPHFAARLALNATRFYVRVAGRYTADPRMAAGGVTHFHFSSDRPEKRRSELLALRSGFYAWWLAQWAANGGSRQEAVVQLDGQWVVPRDG